MINQNAANNAPDLALSVMGLTKTYGREARTKFAVNDLSFELKAGEILGFLGPNGAGKTSTLRMILGLLPPDRGEINLLGAPPGPEQFGRIGFLPEERGLYRKATAKSSIAYMARLNGLGAKQAGRRADELLAQYGLAEARHMKVKALSKGMAQKVQLLAAIAHRPEFIILDEPFSGLDPVNQAQLEDMVRDLAGEGRTIIFSTHVMEHAERLCDRIILMSDGQKIFEGGVNQALKQAPHHLILGLPDIKDLNFLKEYAHEIKIVDTDHYHLSLKPDVNAQNVLEHLMSRGETVSHFQPKSPTLHEAFVALISGSKDKKRPREAAS